MNLRDDRYLPFEHAAAIGRWRLEIPKDPPEFDHATISDVILHLRYTARHDDGLASDDSVKPATAVSARIFLSLKEEFAAEWTAAKAGVGRLEVTIDKQFLPYGLRWSRLPIKK